MTEDDLYIKMEKLRRQNRLKFIESSPWSFKEKIKNFSVTRSLLLLVVIIFVLITCSLISTIQ